MFLYQVLSVYVFIFRCSPVNDCRQVPESVGPELIRWLPGRNCRHKELHPSCTQQQCVKETVPRELDRSLLHESVFAWVIIIAVSSVRIYNGICGDIRYFGLPTGVNDTGVNWWPMRQQRTLTHKIQDQKICISDLGVWSKNENVWQIT